MRMHLSDLQKYILKQVFIRGPRSGREIFLKFYERVGEAEVKIITKSLERLIMKGLAVGFGHKTAEKFFIERVSLTPKGRKFGRKIAQDQQQLPLKLRRH